MCYNIRNKKLIIRLVILSFLSLTISANAQELSKEEQISDLKYYIKKLKKEHIGLYRYTPEKEMNTFLDSVVNSVLDSCTHKEFYKTIRRINARIRCGHTVVNYSDKMIHKEVFIPFNLFSVDNRFYIHKNKTRPYLPIKHKQLISIDNISIDTIIHNMKGYLRADGYIETGKNVELTDFFWQNYAQLIDTNPHHKVVLLDSIGKFDTLTIKSLNINDLMRANRKNSDYVKFYIDATNNYTYIGVSSFFVKYKLFKRRLKDIFSKINEGKIENLVIDLRGNHGGYSKNSYLLLSYLIHEKLEVPIRHFIRRGNKERGWAIEKIKPATKPYSGNLFFLMNGDSFSATSNFLAIAQYLKLGVFIGEETGGAKDGCNSGYYTCKLPNSKLVCKIPVRKTVFIKPLPQKGRGVFPDYPIAYSIDDIIDNKDICIQKVINLIQ